MHLPRLARTLACVTTLVVVASYAESSSAEIPSSRVSAAVAQLDDLAGQIMQRSGIPGMAVAVVHQGKTVYAKGFGVRKVGESTPIDPETVFQLASVSKPIGATVVATQVGKEVVDWNTPIVRNLPWFSLNDPATASELTVGDLYSHQSGLPDHAGDDLEDLGFTRLEIMQRLRFLPSAPLRSRYAYTNLGLTTAAEAVATAAGVEWEDLSVQALYAPLGMASTSSRFSDFIARSNRATPHIRAEDGGFKPGPVRQPDVQTPAGGVSSNVADIARWMNLVLNEGMYEKRQLIPRDALLPAISPQVVTSPASQDRPASHYGYGFNISTSQAGNKQLGHSGAFLMGAGTSFYLLPAANTGIVVLTNALPVGAAEALGLSYLDLVEQGELSRDWYAVISPYFTDMAKPFGRLAGQAFPSNPAPALPAHAYVGNYANDYFGEFHVVQRGGQFFLQMGPASMEWPLQHWDGNTFVFEPGGENAPPGSRSAVIFNIGQGGLAASVAIELYEATGLGTLAPR